MTERSPQAPRPPTRYSPTSNDGLPKRKRAELLEEVCASTSMRSVCFADTNLAVAGNKGSSILYSEESREAILAANSCTCSRIIATSSERCSKV